ncbi:hypothetical protein [Kordia sp.]|uniref:hypothetical protein n=1 Tax=Kordia sp. TaxID=1965332 RepID=UPI003D2782A9
MKSYADKSKQHTTQSVANAISSDQKATTTPLQLKDNRPKTIVQLKSLETDAIPLSTKSNDLVQKVSKGIIQMGKKNKVLEDDKKKKKKSRGKKVKRFIRKEAPKKRGKVRKQRTLGVRKVKPGFSIDDRTKLLGVKLGEGHKLLNTNPKKKNKRKTTPKVEERLTRHMNAAIKGQPSKARAIKMKGQNIAWEVDRATKKKQAERGPRHVLQHQGGGAEGDPLDYFEDRDYGNMSETDSSSD